MKTSKAPSASMQDVEHTESLLAGCRQCLGQCQELLQLVDADVFARAAENCSSIGAHLRHVLDRFQSFFNGLQSDCIDYDERRRDASIEANLEAANFALTTTVRRMRELSANDLQGRAIAIRESVHAETPPTCLDSTIERELMALVTHTTHHLALIAVILRQQGMALDSHFGKAPSTIRHEQS